jgi:UrcA family protein
MKTLLILTSMLTASATPALAQTAPAANQLVVSYADLDLSTDRGVRVLDRRLRVAAETVCGPTSDADLEGKNDARSCRAEALAEARAQRDVAIAGLSPAPQIQLASRR